MTTILLLGTCDTKLPELLYTKHHLQTQDAQVLLVDLGHTPSTHPEIDIGHADIQRHYSSSNGRSDDKGNDESDGVDIASLPKQEYITRLCTLTIPLVQHLHSTQRIHGILSVGGSCGTALATGIMQKAVPVGFPKLMVSTMASGDVTPYVQETDITMMYSVVDIAGTNRILGRILGNATAAVAGMAARYRTESERESEQGSDNGRKKIGITMFGVTTPCVEHIRQRLQSHYEVYVFHATGAGGKAMDRLIAEHQLDAALDLTTTEIADELVGGVLSAGPGRMAAGAQCGIPQVISVGACDMVNFGTKGSVPEVFRNGRKLHEHNPTITLMRTTVDECRDIARFMAQKLKGAARPEKIRIILPTGGVSMLDVPGQAFHDSEADAALFDTLEQELADTPINIRRVPREINHPEFAAAVVESLLELMH